MKIEGEARLLRVFVGESDRHDGRPAYQRVVQKAREARLAGATVLRGMEGFGHAGRVHTAKVFGLSEDLPVVVEIVDTAERIEAFLPMLDEILETGLVTVERVQAIAYRTDEEG